jgi:hypothetical protein
MKRLAAFLILLSSGCASAESDLLIEDGLWGDVRSLFSPRDNSPNPAPTAPSPSSQPADASIPPSGPGHATTP